MHGDIRVKSKLGGGSNFIVGFPARVAPEVAAVSLGGEEVAVVNADVLAGKSYMLLDDIPENTFILEQILRKYNVQISSYQDGALALDSYRSNPSGFDGVITDLRMPLMSGQAFIAELRRFERDAGIASPIPILVMTAENSGEEKRLCLTQYGANDFLLKPVKLRDLIVALAKFHSQNSGTRNARIRRKRVLIIDDEVVGSKFMAAILADEGHVCVNAFSVVEGLSKLSSGTFDVIVLDNLLGDGTGVDFLRKAQIARGSGPKVISVSGNSVEEQKRTYDEAEGAFRIEGYLQKPVRKQDLLGMVRIM